MAAGTTKDRLVTVAIQLALVLLSLTALRWASTRYAELDRQGRSEFTLLDTLFGWPGVWVTVAVVVAGMLFTLGMRLPITRGLRWGPAVWGVVLLALTFHVHLYFWWAEWGLHRREWLDPVTRLLGLDRVTFLEETAVRFALGALAGVAFGCAIGRRRVTTSDVATAPEAPAAAGSLSAPVSG